MHHQLIAPLRGSLSTGRHLLNTLFWCLPVLLLGLVKRLHPRRWHSRCNDLLDSCALATMGGQLHPRVE